MLPALASLLPAVAPAVAPIVSSLFGNAVSAGGSDPLKSLVGALDPFKMLFGQAGQAPGLATPVRSTPATFASPFSGGLDGLVQSLGDIGGRINSATSKMLSDDPKTALQGQLEFQKENLALQRISNIISDVFKVLKTISDNSRVQ